MVLKAAASTVQSQEGSRELFESRNPLKFSHAKKLFVVVAGISTGFNANLGSSLPSGATDAIAEHFSIASPVKLALLNSIYLLGYAIGPLTFGPLSEHVGRRPVLVGTYLAYTLFTLCCAVSPTYEALLAFRFLAGNAAAAPIAVIAPLYADIYDDPEQRGKAIAYFTCLGVAAPNFGPIISGYAGTVSWNLSFWIGTAIAGICSPPVLALPETYAPVIWQRAMHKADILNGPTQELDANFPVISTTKFIDRIRVIFSRPFAMFTQEPIVLFTSIYCAFIYAILFLFFQAYFIIFQDVYGLSPGEVGLTFLPIAAGCFAAMLLFLRYSSYHARALKVGAAWAAKDEYHRLPLACFGGPAIVASLFWLGWTAHISIHPAVPAMSGLLFGIGYLLIFMAMINYLSDAYREYAASAQAAASTTRSLVGVGLPLAASPMYGALGIHWACSLVALIASIMAIIPFVLIRYGEILRKHSRFCQRLLNTQQSASDFGQRS